MKKILTALMASAFALTIYAPSAMACGGSDKKVAKEEKKQDTKKENKKTAEKKKSKKKGKTKG